MITFNQEKVFYSILLGSYLFFIPLDFLTGRILPTGLSTIISILIMGIFLWNVYKKKSVYLPCDLILLSLLVLIGVYFVGFSVNIEFNRIVTLCYYIFSSYAFINLFRWKVKDHLVIQKFVFLGVLVLALYLLIFGEMAYGGTRLAPTQRDLNPNVAGGHVLIGLTTVFSMFRKKNNKWWNLSIIVVAISFLLLQSRTAFLSLFVGLFVALVLWIKDKPLLKRRIIYRRLLLITILAIVVIVFSDVLLRSLNIFDNPEFSLFNPFIRRGQSGTITAGRVDIWMDSFNMLNIFIGNGIMNFRFFNIVAPHSLFVSTFFEMGIIGVSVLLSYFLVLGLHSFKFKKISNVSKYYYQYICIIMILFIFSFGNDVMEYKFFWTGLMISQSVLLSYYNSNKKINIKNFELVL